MENGKVIRETPLKSTAGEFFEGLDPEGAEGDRYFYRLEERETLLPDPSSRWQPDGVHGPSAVVDPGQFRWNDGRWKRPELRDLVVYELHVGTFTEEGTFRAAIEKLVHLRDVGVNAIELMPLADFAGERNWGYDGVSLFAPAHAYGSPDDLRSLVDAAHGVGLAVILDVVYNHFGPDGNYLHSYVGDYLDEAEKTPWGGAIRYGNAEFRPLRELVVSNPTYWMREFHIDGFRLDATHAIIDHSPRHILQELTDAIHASGGIAIAEDPRNDVRLITPVKEGGFGFDAVWADDFHHVIRVANTHESEGYLGDFSGSLREAVDTLKHGWLYRGQLAKSEGKNRGTECAAHEPARFVHCISNHDQTGNHAFGERLSHRVLPSALRAAEVLFCLSPYTPMLFMGQEWATSTPFLFFTDHHEELGALIIEGRREEFKHFAGFNEPEVLAKIPSPQDPSSFHASKLNWSDREHDTHARTLELYKVCLQLRGHEPAFRPSGRDSWCVAELSFSVGALRLKSVDSEWLVLFDLHGGHSGDLKGEEFLMNEERDWKLVFSSNDARFGGNGRCSLDMQTLRADFAEPETIVLRAEI